MPETMTRRTALRATGGAAAAVLGRPALPAPAPAPATTDLSGQGLLVQLQVSDLERSIRFYTELLGFRVSERRDDLQFVHLDCGVPHLQLGLSAGATAPPVPGSVVLNFNVRGDVDDVRARLEARGVRFPAPTRIIPGKVRLAGFEDPDGYRLRLAGDDPPTR
jgi:predicted enzyme related to lactoylglutathione lyase